MAHSMRIFAALAVLAVAACENEKVQVDTRFMTDRVSAPAVLAAIDAVNEKCPTLFKGAKSAQAEVYAGKMPYDYLKTELGMDYLVDLVVTRSDETHYLMLGAGRSAVLVLKKNSTAALCGVPADPKGADIVVPMPALAILAG